MEYKIRNFDGSYMCKFNKFVYWSDLEQSRRFHIKLNKFRATLFYLLIKLISDNDCFIEKVGNNEK